MDASGNTKIIELSLNEATLQFASAAFMISKDLQES